MNFFIDTEFLEGTQKKLFGKTKPTIDLISIGIVSGDNREYYAISKDFNLKEAWNRFQLKINKQYPQGSDYIKEFWIRYNVLKPIYEELYQKEMSHYYKAIQIGCIPDIPTIGFTYSKLKYLIKKYGKTNKQIAREVKYFIADISIVQSYIIPEHAIKFNNPVFYAYYAAYDWVVFCWLFGKMIDLPKDFPMYCRDLKQMFDEWIILRYLGGHDDSPEFKNVCNLIKEGSDYPKQTNEHNALYDAKFNRDLYLFLEKNKIKYNIKLNERN